MRSGRQFLPDETDLLPAAMLIDDGEHLEIQISGTASIDKSGRTIHHGQPLQQIRRALQNVHNLLREQNFRIDDICIRPITSRTTRRSVVSSRSDVSWGLARSRGPVSSPIFAGPNCCLNLMP